MVLGSPMDNDVNIQGSSGKIRSAPTGSSLSEVPGSAAAVPSSVLALTRVRSYLRDEPPTQAPPGGFSPFPTSLHRAPRRRLCEGGGARVGQARPGPSPSWA